METAPWSDFQTKAFTELNAKGDAYDMVVGDSQWLGAASTGGHYVELWSCPCLTGQSAIALGLG